VRDHLRLGHVAGVDDHRVRGRAQRRHRPGGIQVVAASHVGQNTLVVVGQTRGDVLVVAPPGTGLRRRGQEDLHRRVGQYHGPDVSALDDDVARTPGHGLLQFDEPGAHSGYRRHRRNRSGYLVTADLGRNIFSFKVTSDRPGVVTHRQLHLRGNLFDGFGVRRLDSGTQNGQRHDPIHRPGIQIACTKRLRQSP
jgi:hypothetical protein